MHAGSFLARAESETRGAGSERVIGHRGETRDEAIAAKQTRADEAAGERPDVALGIGVAGVARVVGQTAKRDVHDNEAEENITDDGTGLGTSV